MVIELKLIQQGLLIALMSGCSSVKDERTLSEQELDEFHSLAADIPGATSEGERPTDSGSDSGSDSGGFPIDSEAMDRSCIIHDHLCAAFRAGKDAQRWCYSVSGTYSEQPCPSKDRQKCLFNQKRQQRLPDALYYHQSNKNINILCNKQGGALSN